MMAGGGAARKPRLLPGEREWLRELAARQAEAATTPENERRRRKWYALNDGVPGAEPPVVVETWTFDRDFLPDSVFRCASPEGRAIERQLLRAIRTHELIGDDTVVPDTFDMNWEITIDEFGVTVPMEMRQDAQGVETGYRWEHPIRNLERDFHRLRPAVCQVDRAATEARRAFLQDLLGDRLPVVVRGPSFGQTMLTHRAIMLMGMQAFYEALIETPAAVHRLLDYLRDNALRIMRWAEAEGLLTPNAGHQASFGSSLNFTTCLPSAGTVGLSDLWGASNSQESIGISPAMFNEFCFPRYREVCAPFGLLYWGCCEPANPFWTDLVQLPNLKKVSVPKWADLPFLAEAVRGTGIILSRKPDPNLIGVHPVLDEDAWRAHIREALRTARGVPMEFILRDVYTVHGNLGKVRRAVEIAREEIARRG